MKKLIIWLILASLALPSHANAEAINSFDVNIKINTDGTLNVTENIFYDFGINDKHGIFRDIPRSTKVANKYRIQDYTVNQVLKNRQTEPYKTSFNGDNYNIKIGDPDKTISGEHRYTVEYSVKNGLATLENQDELYWNITGNGWQIPMMSASATIQLPPTVPVTQATCYTGIEGSREQNCNISQDKLRFTTQGLAAHEGLTIVATFPADTFPKNILSETAANSLTKTQITLLIAGLVTLLVSVNLIIPLFVYRWFKTKTQSRKNIQPHVNFDFPQDPQHKRLAPALAGSIDTAQLEQNDVIATLYDLAIRKHIKILQEIEETNILIFNKKDKKYYIEKIATEAQDTLADHEKILLDRLFQSSNRIDISTLKDDFYKTFEAMEKSVYRQLQEKGYYKGSPKTRKTLLTTLGIITIFSGGFVLAPLLIYIANQQTNRTSLGDKADEQIDGLKQFLQKMDRNYSWQADQLAIVEHMIPYAMALGYIDKFMEQLKIIQPHYQPTWYSGNTPFYNMNANLMNTMNSSFSTNAPSSSSGMSGGSGGGGGGGGGGSW